MIDLTIPPGRAPDELLAEVRTAVFDRVEDAAAGAQEWPSLTKALRELRAAQHSDDPVRLDQALVDSVTAHVGALVRLPGRHTVVSVERARLLELLPVVFGGVDATRDAPPQLGDCVIEVRATDGAAAPERARALLNGAVAHIAAIARLRAEYPDLGGV